MLKEFVLISNFCINLSLPDKGAARSIPFQVQTVRENEKGNRAGLCELKQRIPLCVEREGLEKVCCSAIR